MSSFEFNTVPRIFFGRGRRARISELVRGLGQKVMVIYSGEPTEAALSELLGTMPPAEQRFRQRGEPTVADVDAATAQARSAGCDVVIGIGGGSAIDAAKAVAGLLTNGGSARDYMEVVGEGRKIASPAAPWIAVPTTAGTGAEATRNAVIGLPEKQFKASIRSELLLPRIAVIDPELGVDVPPEVTARSGMDALCQCIEAYTSTGATPMTDPLALEGVRRAGGGALLRAVEDGRDLDARQDMALAALFSGIALTNAGLGAVHGFAAPLGASFPVPHGAACAVLLPGAMRANVQALRAAGDPVRLGRYAEIGRALGAGPASDEAAIAFALDRVAQLLRRLQIPSLSHFGLTERDIPAIVQLARKASSMRYNPVELSDEVLARILREAM